MRRGPRAAARSQRRDDVRVVGRQRRAGRPGEDVAPSAARRGAVPVDTASRSITSGRGERSTRAARGTAASGGTSAPLRKSRYCSRRTGSSIARSASRPARRRPLHLEEVGLGEVLQAVPRGVRGELVEVDGALPAAQLVVQQRRVAAREQPLGLARARAPGRSGHPRAGSAGAHAPDRRARAGRRAPPCGSAGCPAAPRAGGRRAARCS